MNILISCSGRRNYIVEYFKEALAGSGLVYTINSTADASSMQVSDRAIVAPPIYDSGYIEFVLDLCERNSIELLVSLFDMELPVLAANRKLFEVRGIRLAVSGYDVVSICNDKCATVDFADSLHIPTLYTTTNTANAMARVDEKKIAYPLYVKPRWGMGSIAVQIVNNKEELRVLYNKSFTDINNTYLQYYSEIDMDSCVIIQERATGTEFGLDVINDLDGNYVSTFVKKKLAMRAGETDVAQTMDVRELRNLGEKIGRNLKHVGVLDVDVFWDGMQAVILEMNARFGGGYPFSHLAGANIPKAYMSWAKNELLSGDEITIDYGVKGLKGINMMVCNQGSG